MSDDTIDNAVGALKAAQQTIEAMPLEQARGAVERLHEAVWHIDEDMRHREQKRRE